MTVLLQGDQTAALHSLLEEENSKVLNQTTSMFDQTVQLGNLSLVSIRKEIQLSFNSFCLQLFDLFRRTCLSRSISRLSSRKSKVRRNILTDSFVKTYISKPHIVIGSFQKERYSKTGFDIHSGLS